jgi:hypothetical protein
MYFIRLYIQISFLIFLILNSYCDCATEKLTQKCNVFLDINVVNVGIFGIITLIGGYYFGSAWLSGTLFTKSPDKTILKKEKSDYFGEDNLDGKGFSLAEEKSKNTICSFDESNNHKLEFLDDLNFYDSINLNLIELLKVKEFYLMKSYYHDPLMKLPTLPYPYTIHREYVTCKTFSPEVMLELDKVEIYFQTSANININPLPHFDFFNFLVLGALPNLEKGPQFEFWVNFVLKTNIVPAFVVI